MVAEDWANVVHLFRSHLIESLDKERQKNQDQEQNKSANLKSVSSPQSAIDNNRIFHNCFK